MRRILILLSTCLMLLVGVAAPAGAKSDARPFAGNASGPVTFVSTELPRVCPTFPFLTTTVTNIPGRAMHLGRMSLSSQHCAGFGLIEGGDMELVAANGDKVLIDYTVEAPMVPTAAFKVDVQGTIHGGTGRFHDASGHVDMTGSVKFPNLPSFDAASIAFVWTGHISY